MTLEELRASVRLPVIAAPMFLVSGQELVTACCKAGVIGCYPLACARTGEEARQVLVDINQALSEERHNDPLALIAPLSVNLVVHDETQARFQEDLLSVLELRVPLVITSVGNPQNVVRHVHEYGGLVFHDVASVRHARKAIEAGVDGLILLTAGAGGHTGTLNPFAFVEQVRTFWDGAIVLAGGISDGRSVRSVEVLGADYAYMGTRFSATEESMASPAYKALLVSQQSADVLVTDSISGLAATFMRGSIAAVGLDPDHLPPRLGLFQPDLPEHLKAWRDIWSAGHGVGTVEDLPSVAVLVERLERGYERASEKR